jgi:DNA modification methylase
MNLDQLILGDNLQVLKNMSSESVDLCYIDPPFFSNRNYEVIWGDEGEVASFTDRWSGGIDHYIGWLKERIEEIWRVLKKTGVICVHCDWHADAYIRVHILDKLHVLSGKGRSGFLNEIIWKRKTGCGETIHKSNHFGCSTDMILVYSKSKDNTFNSQFTFDEDGYQNYINKAFCHIDANGRRYRIDNLASPSPVRSLMYEYKGYKPPKNGWALSLEKMEQFEREERLYFPKSKNGRIQRKRFFDELRGKPVQNLWCDIKPVASQSKERIGYPTQKPLALMDRIIKTFSNEGDVVLDAFCGGGTTLVAAQRLKRKFIGIDNSAMAIHIASLRLEL